MKRCLRLVVLSLLGYAIYITCSTIFCTLCCPFWLSSFSTRCVSTIMSFLYGLTLSMVLNSALVLNINLMDSTVPSEIARLNIWCKIISYEDCFKRLCSLPETLLALDTAQVDCHFGRSSSAAAIAMQWTAGELGMLGVGSCIMGGCHGFIFRRTWEWRL